MTDTGYTPPPVPSNPRWNGGSAASDGGSARWGGYASGARASLTKDAGNLRQSLVGGFGKLLDAVEPHLDRAPANLQPAARKAMAFSRERPLATMAGLTALALVLAGGSRRR